MRITAPLLLALALTACNSTTLTSETLSDAEISAIQERVQEMHPSLSEEKQRAVVELAVNAMDNMVFVKGGSFMMGEFGIPCEPGATEVCMSDYEKSNDYAHKVVLDDYHLSKYETTIRDFDTFRDAHGKKPYKSHLRIMEDRQHYFEPNKPAWTGNWREVRNYCLWIGRLTNTEADLPTEAQWEYAARNRGKNVLHATNDGNIRRGKNYPEAVTDSDMKAVGSFSPNPLGIYDLNHNSMEWVFDWYSTEYYQNSDILNPTGPAEGDSKVIRGGASYSSPEFNTTVGRWSRDWRQDEYHSSLGFRCGIR